MQKVFFLVVFVCFISAGYAQIYPQSRTWEQLENSRRERTIERGEIMDGSYLQKDKEKYFSQPIPADAKVIKTKITKPVDAGVTLLTTSPEPQTQFEALGDGQTRGIATIPPDTYGTVGKGEAITTLNSELRVQNKTNGIQIGSVQGVDNFFSSIDFGGSAPDVFDPRIVFDPFAERYTMVYAVNGSNVANSGFVIAVSKTSNPLNGWDFYAINTDASGTTWFDFPYVSFNRRYLLITGNMFNSSDNFQRSKAYVIEKSALYSQAPLVVNANYREVSLAAGTFSNCGISDYDQTTDSLYIITTANGNTGGNSSFRLTSISGDISSLTYTDLGFIVNEGVTWNSSGGSNDFATQFGSTRRINTGDSRMGNAMRLNNRLWFAHTVFLPAGNPTYCGVEWLQTSIPGNILQHQIIATPGQFRYYPSIAVNKSGDALVGYSVSDANMWVGGAYSYRSGSDPLNTTRSEYIYVEGRAAYNKTFGGSRNRWGDYSNTIIDPIDQGLWTIQQFASSPALINNQLTSMWGTWWAKLAPSTPLGPLPITLLSFNATVVNNNAVQVTWKVAVENEIGYYEVERSKNGIAFETVGRVNSKRVNGESTYSYTDDKPFMGKSYYRLKVSGSAGTKLISKVVPAEIRVADPTVLSVSPNPFADRIIVNFYAPKEGKFSIKLIDASGKVITNNTQEIGEGYYLDEIQAANLPKGVYFLQIESESGWHKSFKVLH